MEIHDMVRERSWSTHEMYHGIPWKSMGSPEIPEDCFMDIDEHSNSHETVTVNARRRTLGCPKHSGLICPAVGLHWNIGRPPVKRFKEFHRETFLKLPRTSMDMVSWVSMKRFIHGLLILSTFHESA